MSWIEDPGVSNYKGFNISKLAIDQAWINITALLPDTIPLWIYELSTDCHKCPYQKKESEPIYGSGLNKHIVSTTYPMKYRFRTNGSAKFVPESAGDSFKFCDIEYQYGEFGVYNILIGGSAKEPNCRVETTLEPVNIYYPLLLACLFYLVFGILVFIASSSHTRLKSLFASSRSTNTSSSTVDNSPAVGEHETANVNGIRRLSSGLGTGTLTTLTSNPNGNGHGHNPQHNQYHQQNGNGNYAGSYSPTSTTEVSISTISSTPTSTSVTTYGKPHSAGTEIGNSGESPSTITSSATLRTPINQTTSNNNANLTQPSTAARQTRQRLRSLDTFRGMCIVIMIFVNDGGAHYYFLEHATWDGLYIADLVFPWFLWIMGVCIPVSIKSQVKRGTSRIAILQRIFIRSCKLIAIGLVLGSLWGPVDIYTMRLPGVLQRFGICYFICSTLVLFCMTVNITKPETSKLRAALQDVQIIWISWIIVLLVVLLHCCLTFFLLVPGCPTGYLGPGGLHDGNSYPGYCIGGAAGYIDQQVLQTRHIYQYPTAKSTYNAGAYDPEGLLGILTSIFQVWLGVQTGVTMLVYPRAASRLKRWGAWALITGAAGGLLCGCKQTGGWIPLNKNLWSLSFVLVTNCFALVLLSAMYFVIDIKRWWSGAPFFEPGMNSILLYVGHSVANSMLPWHYAYGPMRTHFSHLIESLWGTSLWVLISVYLYQKKKFWTV